MTVHASAKLERLTFFSDAVFAIAMTLLVIDVRVPHLKVATDQILAQALVDLLPNYIGFVVSFLVIARFWIGHHRLLGMLDVVDPALVRANLALLMAIAFMPFPTAVLSEYSPLRVAVGFYTAFLVVAGLANMHLIRVALARRTGGDLAETAGDEQALRRSMWLPLAIGASGFVAGMVQPTFGLVVMTVGAPAVFLVLTKRADRANRRRADARPS